MPLIRAHQYNPEGVPMNYTIQENNIVIHSVTDFDLAQTLDCGQAFRWEVMEDGSFRGGARNKPLRIALNGSDLTLYNTPKTDLPFWVEYLDLDTDYSSLKTCFSQNDILAKAVEFAPGLRILRQDKWEALCSFIISQNNNIKRIKGIINKLCQTFGEDMGGGYYSFPTAKALSQYTVEDLAELRAGFRARYILDAAKKVSSGEVDLQKVALMPLDDARKELMKIIGVGVKVADCALLFGFYRVESYPVDVWIKRVNQHMFPKGLPEYVLPYAGIAQQYLFHYARVCPEAFDFIEEK